MGSVNPLRLLLRFIEWGTSRVLLVQPSPPGGYLWGGSLSRYEMRVCGPHGVGAWMLPCLPPGRERERMKRKVCRRSAVRRGCGGSPPSLQTPSKQASRTKGPAGGCTVVDHYSLARGLYGGYKRVFRELEWHKLADDWLPSKSLTSWNAVFATNRCSHMNGSTVWKVQRNAKELHPSELRSAKD